jgi:hypothetical protein
MTAPDLQGLSDIALGRLDAAYRARIAAFADAVDANRRDLAAVAAVRESRAGGLDVLAPINIDEESI